MRIHIGLCLIAMLAACGDTQEASPTVRLTIDAAPQPEVEPLVTPDPVEPLSEAAAKKVKAIRDVIARNSLSRFTRLANAEPSFVSNFAGEAHRVHWDLLRRTGFDPLAQIEQLLDGPYGTRMVGEELWYIWPDLAALPPEGLVPERLSFSDRARLSALVGETGIARIRSGQGYPGVRTAIASDGRWLYFVHETEDETQNEANEE